METNLEKGHEAQTEKPSLFGVITSPGVQFERMRVKPVIGMPLIIVLAMIIVGTVLQGLGMDYGDLMRESGLTGEELEMAQSFAAIGGIIGGIFAGVAMLFIAPLIYWLCVKISGGTTTYKKMLSLTLFISFITSLGLLINGIVLYFTDANSFYSVTSLASLITSDQPLTSALSAFEIFSIWGYVLLAIGLQKTGGISKKSAWISVIVLFALMLLYSFITGFFNSQAGV
ncbi:Yip1 family protein [Bacillus atrophaeus]|uniref:Yip1 family protein n=1 Tax=Bacillus atrophaeus TaxID=1452 RepID=UPI0022815A22|nr:Yip1 family protein [Bacillus atrophaeus]MCY8512470.1 YIP1 family protein [Bacillus atrophaeus]MCY8516428.1 YIP1 family protein [Bacillus atrophaeus]MCY8992094.1 YIP1 family protein [Bacillus atrophaeus]MCY9110359.1 YIP1 family protein [Bacillus atrophaeus]